MEDTSFSSIPDGTIKRIRFGLATSQEIRIASISDFPIGHGSQLTNSFLGLPLESGKCESCGAAEPGKCDGHFGYIELPIPIFHPSHVGELKRMLSLLCLQCLKIKKSMFLINSNGVSIPFKKSSASCCEVLSRISVKDVRNTDGSYCLHLKMPSNPKPNWDFLKRYGFSYGDKRSRPLLPVEVVEILKKMPPETRKKLASKGFFPQEGYTIQFLPVPPNCLSLPEISDGISVISSDHSITLLKKILRNIEIIKSSRSGPPNFQSQEDEANVLQSLVVQYLDVRGTTKASRDAQRFGMRKDDTSASTKAWLEKMRTLFIRKGSGFSSRSVITGDVYKGVNEVGIPFEIAQKITFEEKVNEYNMKYLQKLVDDKLCLTYRDGLSTYSLREGSKGHTFLKPGQVVHRRIMDGDIVFINRPPTTHKHSLQALSVYVHDDHTVKINPLICGPLSADFDGDCVHLFYPQSLAAKAEVLELFLVGKQLLSSHNDSVNLQISTDSLLSLNKLFNIFFVDKATTQQLAMFVSTPLPPPSLLKAHSSGPSWTALQILQTALPEFVDSAGEKCLIKKSELLKVDIRRDGVKTVINEIVTSVLFEKGSKELLGFYNVLQPMLMEFLALEGVTVGLGDFLAPSMQLQKIYDDIQEIYQLLFRLRLSFNELVQLQLENHFKQIKSHVASFIQNESALGSLIDLKSESAMLKVVQQIGFLGLQLSDRGKFYTQSLVEDMAHLFRTRCQFDVENPAGEFGMVRSSFFSGLNPFEEIVHSISSREVMVRSSRGLAEPGTLFKNLMAILRDVVICYDGTVRNVCSNSIIMFEYGPVGLYPAGEPVGVLAATAMSNPAYRAVLDSSPSSNSSWVLMKEILLSRVSFKNDLIDRRVILYLNNCCCGRQYCRESAAYLVMNQLRRVSLRDIAVNFMIEYKNQQVVSECLETEAALIGHIHLNKALLSEKDISMPEILKKCEQNIISYRKKKKIAPFFKGTALFFSELCTFQQSCESNCSDVACLRFLLQDYHEKQLQKISGILSEMICPVLLDTIVKGDPRIHTVNISWISYDSTMWVRNPYRTHNGEVALDVVLDREAVKESGDAWRLVLDSCIPYIDLIDTRRSIPYGIKQVQELLGISCAFDQAVQRLSTSVAMVAKGVRKEHLMLLANSMTSGGNLIGFNVGGFKALFRSLDIQVPVTEATLFTPRKCFERAAEKCHLDSLSSVVASCSWGKHVSVGTGSGFDILWDKKEVGVKQEGGVDVYSFLHLVRGVSSGQVDPVTGCLGAADVDDIMWDYEYSDICPSPDVQNPVFEETIELQSNEQEAGDQSNWNHPGDSNLEKGETDNWDEGTKNNDGNSSWGQQTDSNSHNWDEGSNKNNTEFAWGWKGESASVDNNCSNWGKESLNTPVKSTPTWGETKAQPQWNQQKKSPLKEDQSEKWGSIPKKTEAEPQWGKHKDSTSYDLGEDLNAWGLGRDPNEMTASNVSLQNCEQPTNMSEGWGSQEALPPTHSSDKDQSKTEGLGLPPWEGRHNESDDQQRSNVGWNESQGQGEKNDLLDSFDQGWNAPAKKADSGNFGNWGAPKQTRNELSQLENLHGGNEFQATPQWKQQTESPFQRSRSNNSLGWGQPNAGDWKNKPQGGRGGLGDNRSGIFTVTRHRLDMFTSEEQNILSDIEPIMHSLRRIMHNPGFNDGDPLSSEDQKYIIENVLNYHPSKEAKMGVGIDYITVMKHDIFEDSRCMFIVRSDGHKEDFSYRKCLKNFVEGKYPDLAEGFNEKYFEIRKPPPRPAPRTPLQDEKIEDGNEDEKEGNH